MQSDSALCRQALVPVSIRYFPAPQLVHEEEPEELYFPAPQTVHEAEPEELYFPAPQLLHERWNPPMPHCQKESHNHAAKSKKAIAAKKAAKQKAKQDLLLARAKAEEVRLNTG